MNPRNILIVRPDRLGDLILSLPVARVLKDNFPECNVTYLAAPGPAGIAPLTGFVDNWIVDKGRNGRMGLLELTSAIKTGSYDYMIELKPSWRTACAGFLTGVPVRIGTGRRLYSIFYNRRLGLHRRGSGRHQVDLDLAMLQPLGIGASGIMPSLAIPEFIKKEAGQLVGESIKEYIVIHPGSGGSAPNWPIIKYKELAGLISKEIAVVITGQESTADRFDGCLDLSGKTDLVQLAGVISKCRVFISGSTGPLHMADALGIKCVSLFSDHPDVGASRWGPRRNMENVLVPEGPACNQRNLSRCRCLEQITPGRAFNRVKMLLNSKN